MQKENCQLSDIESIVKLYEAARNLQIERKMVVWPHFENAFVEEEILEHRQWKIVIDGQIACNWAITYADKEIWEEKDQNDSIYIHRICNNPAYRGMRFIDQIVAWAKIHAKENGKRFVRLYTLGNNTGLIKHYTSSGFKFLGIFQLTDTSTLPKHYQDEADCCLFEIDLEQN